MRPLEIIALLDGRPGHEKQTGAVIASLAALTPIQVVERSVAIGVADMLGNWLRYGFGLPGRCPVADNDSQTVDLIIGTGTRTHLPALLCRRRHPGAKAVCCMMPDFPLSRAMDLCLVPLHDAPPPRANVFTTLGPPCHALSEGNHDQRRCLILVGGVDSKSHYWDTNDVVNRIRSLIAAGPDRLWTIGSSPRTPAATDKRLALLAAEFPLVSYFPAKTTPSGWIEQQYQANGQVWVTADSISMVYEALSAGCAVGLLPVRWKHRGNKFQQSIDMLREKKLLVASGEFKTPTPHMGDRPRLDEADRCAREILRQWWQDRIEPASNRQPSGCAKRMG